MLLLRVFKMAYNSVIGIATTNPNTVVTNAVEIPPAINLGSPVPNKVIAWKVLIMPETVPSSPINGATTEITLIILRDRPNLGTSPKIDSVRCSSSASVSASG